MDTKKLRQKILDLAIHGKLVPQDPNDEPASVLLERIKAEKERLGVPPACHVPISPNVVHTHPFGISNGTSC